MRHPTSSEATSTSVGSAGSSEGIAMEYSDDSGKKQGQQEPQHQQQGTGSYALPQESRQQAPQRSSQQNLQAQQQQQSWPAHQQEQQTAYAHPQAYAYQQQANLMASMSRPGHDQATDYQLSAQQAQHQQYLQQQGAQLGQPGQVGGTYTSGYLTSAQQYAASINYQQQLSMQQSMMASGIPPHQQQQLIQQHPMGIPNLPQQPQQQSFGLQPRIGRLPADRPLIKLSVSLIDTYKRINTVYYEEREARRAARAKEKNQKGQGTNNNGWDDDNYDYIVTQGELFYGKYRIKERIGKGSFGQVVRAEDTETQQEVAIKIIKSKKPFLLQAKTEIELLQHLNEKDPDDQHNIGKLNDD